MKANANASIDVSLGNDLLWGVEEIGRELGLSRTQVYHQLETGRLPAFKQGGKWVASRSGLRRHFATILAGKAV
jgi:hypothetical protein